MKAILLSIKPEYVDRILAGTKKYEYRKRLARSNSSVLLVYSTSPVMKVVAKVEYWGLFVQLPPPYGNRLKVTLALAEKNIGNIFMGAKQHTPMN